MPGKITVIRVLLTPLEKPVEGFGDAVTETSTRN